MTGPVIPRDEAFANARRVLDIALADIAADYAAGRLSPERELIVRRLLRQQREQPTPRPLAA
ncbi:hypothetical protein SEA_AUSTINTATIOUS_31 [Streptomyces phage Austintatious]|uniref:Uncharacterized protein n=1 Tax=Streptomyces phage Austintatious TaxID=2500795 RepID=A0A411AXG9_9CAUD|nr:hypothetical protein HOV10_gp31 [Streptomyces phage Austintatious]QAX92792.1 hypothetical protein SEA_AUSTINTATIOUS_31 [Streptomyces phage Austintatious]